MAEKILVVDDDLDTVRLVGLMLERQGFEIVAANNGHQAVVLARSEKPNRRFGRVPAAARQD